MNSLAGLTVVAFVKAYAVYCILVFISVSIWLFLVWREGDGDEGDAR